MQFIMKTKVSHAGILPTLALCAACLTGLAADLTAQLTPSLWVADDVAVTIYNVKLDGTVVSSFHSGSISGLSLGVDERFDTIWGAKEGSNLIMRYDTKGKVLSSFPGTTYDVNATAPEGVAVDPVDGTLWIVDDATLRVYNVTKSGELISSFPTWAFDAGVQSPQDIAADPGDGTLWLTDNGTDRIYKVTREGVLVSSFPTASFAAGATNPQGLGIDPTDRTLWVTDRATKAIYHVSQFGALLSSIDASGIGTGSPTGVAFAAPKQPTLPGLIADLEQGVEDGQIGPGPAGRLTGIVKSAMSFQKQGDLHPATKHLLVFHTAVGKLSGDLVDEELAASLQASTEYLVQHILEL
jgi:sugar lactone lactonase YvrE